MINCNADVTIQYHFMVSFFSLGNERTSSAVITGHQTDWSWCEQNLQRPYYVSQTLWCQVSWDAQFCKHDKSCLYNIKITVQCMLCFKNLIVSTLVSLYEDISISNEIEKTTFGSGPVTFRLILYIVISSIRKLLFPVFTHAMIYCMMPCWKSLSHILFPHRQQALFHVLAAYSMYNTEVGYCQGMSQIAALLLMYMNEEVKSYKLTIN